MIDPGAVLIEEAAHLGHVEEPVRVSRAIGKQIPRHVREILAESALTLNPLSGIRGSSVKVIESLTAGRICISTTEGARGLLEANHRGLVTADTVAATMSPILRLLRNPAERHNLEQPCAATLARHYWPNCAEVQVRLYYRLLGAQPPAVAAGSGR